MKLGHMARRKSSREGMHRELFAPRSLPIPVSSFSYPHFSQFQQRAEGNTVKFWRLLPREQSTLLIPPPDPWLREGWGNPQESEGVLVPKDFERSCSPCLRLPIPNRGESYSLYPSLDMKRFSASPRPSASHNPWLWGTSLKAQIGSLLLQSLTWFLLSCPLWLEKALFWVITAVP